MFEHAADDKLQDLHNKQDVSFDLTEWEIIEGDFDKLRKLGELPFTPEMREVAERIRADAGVTQLTAQYRKLVVAEHRTREAHFSAKRRCGEAQKELLARVSHLIEQETEKDALTLKIQAVKELRTDVLRQLSDGVEVDITAALKHLEAI